jgi:hypothetical protein
MEEKKNYSKIYFQKQKFVKNIFASAAACFNVVA